MLNLYVTASRVHLYCPLLHGCTQTANAEKVNVICPESHLSLLRKILDRCNFDHESLIVAE